MFSTSDSVYSRKNPFPAKLLANRVMALEGTTKETRHFEISLAGSDLKYEAGDAAGIFPTNNPVMIEELLAHFGFSGEEEVPRASGGTGSIRSVLMTDCDVRIPGVKFLRQVVLKEGRQLEFAGILNPENKRQLDGYLRGREVIDILLAHPTIRFTPEEFVSGLRPLTPRLYSIASSPKLYPEALHLMVAVVRYESFGRKRGGVATTFLADRVTESTPVPVFVHSAKGFRLPEDNDLPVIMVGPGAGLAPFRGYLQERQARGAKGKNWLFFGEQREKSNFFYKDELEQYQRDGLLNRLSTAFSRDQDYKIYVQNRMVEPENAKELWRWLEEGAHFFVCGDAERMAKDVDAALLRIVREQGGKSPEEAIAYVDAMRKEKRYKRDVY